MQVRRRCLQIGCNAQDFTVSTRYLFTASYDVCDCKVGDLDGESALQIANFSEKRISTSRQQKQKRSRKSPPTSMQPGHRLLEGSTTDSVSGNSCLAGSWAVGVHSPFFCFVNKCQTNRQRQRRLLFLFVQLCRCDYYWQWYDDRKSKVNTYQKQEWI